jgi:Protein of unknown function (DUF2889)
VPYELPVIGRILTNAVSGPANPSPSRPTHSVRRTSTIDVDFPKGFTESRRVRGRARDFLTNGEATKVLADDVLMATVNPDRSYEFLFSFPDRPALQAMVGPAGTPNSRRAMNALVPEEQAAGSPLYLLLDDMPGAIFISGHVPVEWIAPEQRLSVLNGDFMAPVDACVGYAAGSNAIGDDGKCLLIHQVQPAGALMPDGDPLAWHKLQEESDQPALRRARRIDVWLDGAIHFDAYFQDSTTTPSHGRVAVHEYCLNGTADPQTGELLTLNVDPRVLPFDACPKAAKNVDRMIGIALQDFRHAVVEQLPGTLGCTHLNDALRALAEVPILVTSLQ